MVLHDTICALSTAQGMGAIAVIRLSGDEAFTILDACFKPVKKEASAVKAKGYSLLFGKIMDGNTVVDEVLVSFFKNPHSYTGQNVVEVSCHGSVYIQKQLLRLFQKLGARMAEAGEFTLRAFANAKLDLTQAEAVADLIASESKAAHQVAMQQMRGGFSLEIKELREQLIKFASLIELELDFGEEDVEFADRGQLHQLLAQIKSTLQTLLQSYQTGNVIKNGLPVAIVGAPNVGKSTLLNTLLNEDKAIVTEIAGTTRDAIEDELILGGIRFRFIDTAGIRATDDVVEQIGIKKTYAKIAESSVVFYLFDAQANGFEERLPLIEQELEQLKSNSPHKTILAIANKMDVADKNQLQNLTFNYLGISAQSKTGMEALKKALLKEVDLAGLNSNQTIVTNERHFNALQTSLTDIEQIEQGLANQISGDFLAQDIREALRHLGEIIGTVDVDQDILGAIFSKFCIGK